MISARRDLVLELGNPGLVQALGILGRMIFRILGQIAVRARVGDLLDDARTLLGLEAVQLGFELLEPLDGHRHLFHRHSLTFLMSARTQRRRPRSSFTQSLGFGQP